MNEATKPNSILDTLLNHHDFKEGALWQRRHYEPNTTVFSEGDRGRDVYLIVKGTVRVQGSVDLDAKRQIRPGFSDLGEGEVFGELALFDNHPRSASVSTVTACDLIAIDGDQLMQFLDTHPDLGYPLFKALILILVGRLRQADRKIFGLFAWGLKARGIDKYL
ncbi:MAG TPA: cyclic nucleotide-binding domain-containing protein [Gammaproteobacteria bacterium]|nr:cyclic nucleotide-binding domain-containing protein [Gammaproteobacteria bacterium]